jgi:hypothetical protein
MRNASMRPGIRKLLNFVKVGLFDEGGVEEIFRHARNLVIATLVMAAGNHAIDNAPPMKALGVIDIRVTGYSVVVLGILLFGINFVDGLYRLSKLKQSVFLQFAVIAIYLLVTVRVAQLIIALRTT